MAIEKKEIEEAGLVEVPVQTAIAYKIGEEVIDDKALLVRIYNMLKRIETAVV